MLVVDLPLSVVVLWERPTTEKGRVRMKLATIDFESDNSQGMGLLIYHKDFRVTSMSVKILGEDECRWTDNPEQIREWIHGLHADGYVFNVYNAAFDCAILKHLYGIENVFHTAVDTWRLFNYCNQIVNDKHASKKSRSTSLVGAVDFFFKVKDYKAPYLEKIIEMGLARTHKEAHANIASLPSNLLERYNNEDVTWTEKVFVECLRLLKEWGIDSREDHRAYMRETELYSDSFFRGVNVDRGLLAKNIETLGAEIAQIDKKLRERPEIRIVEESLNPIPTVTKAMRRKFEQSEEYVLGYEDQDVANWKRKKDWKTMNWGSTKHKRKLFIDVLGFDIEKLTPTGEPCMSKALLGKFGDLGKMLKQLLGKSKEREECERLMVLSSYDGKLHPSLRSGQTVSGRSSSKNS